MEKHRSSLSMMYFADVAGAMALQNQQQAQAQAQQAQSQSQNWRSPPYAQPVRRATSPSRRPSERSGNGKRTSLFSLRTKSSAGHRHQAAERATSRSSPTTEAGPIAEDDALASWVFFGQRKRGQTQSNGPRSPSPVDADDESIPRTKSRRAAPAGGLDRSTTPYSINTTARTGSPDQPSPESARKVLRKSQYAPIAAPPESMQTSLASRDSKKRPPPPLRPKRSDELLEEALRSAPLYGMSDLRPVRSAEPMHQSSLLQVTPPPVRARSPGLGIQRAVTSPMMKSYASSSRSPSSPRSVLSPPPPPSVIRESEFGATGEWDRLMPVYEGRASPSMSSYNEAPELHYLPSFSAPLEKVIEEPEGCASRRSSVVAKKPSLRHAKSTPNISKQSPVVKPIISEVPKIDDGAVRPVSISSETLGVSKQSVRDSVSSFNSAILSRSSRDLSTQASSVEFSWESYVDFCYQNAAEADCDFDWEHPGSRTTEPWATPCPWEPKRRLGRHRAKSSTDSSQSNNTQNMSKTQEFFDNLHLTPESTPDLSYLSASLESSGSFIPPTPAAQSVATMGVKPGPHISLSTAPFIGGLTLKEDGGMNTLSIYSPIERQSLLEQKLLAAAMAPKTRTRGPSFSAEAQNAVRMAPTSAPSPAVMQQSMPTSRGRSASAVSARPNLTVDSIVSRLRGPSPTRALATSPQATSPYDAQFVWDTPAANKQGALRLQDIHTSLTRTDSDSTLSTIRASADRPLTPPETPAAEIDTPLTASDAGLGLLLLPAKAYDPAESKRARSPMPEAQLNKQTQAFPPTPPSPPYMTPEAGSPLAWSPAVGNVAGFASTSPALSSASFKTAPTGRKRGNTLITAIPTHMQQQSPVIGSLTPILPQTQFTPTSTSSPFMPTSGFTPITRSSEFPPVSPVASSPGIPPPVPMKDAPYLRKMSSNSNGSPVSPPAPERSTPSPTQGSALKTRTSYSLFPSASASKKAVPMGLGLGVMALGPPPSRPVPSIPTAAGKARA